MRRFFLVCLLQVACVALMAQNPASSPAGRWKTIDDATGHAKAIVLLTEQNGVLSGTIEKVLETEQPGPNPVCLKCEGDLKNHPLNGLRILWDLKRSGSDWAGGQILDPKSGKVYRCTVTLTDGGKTLKVRGFIGIAMLGRTQSWQRID